jgi:membrane fusion protein (multidrug efflux system)
MTALAGLLLLAVWTVWFLAARVSVYEVSRSARVEAETASHQVDAPVAGRVVSSALALGRAVGAGDLLVELESDRYRLERDAQLTELRVLGPQIEALRRELAEEGNALHGEGLVAASAEQEERARQRASVAMERLKTDEHTQLETLQAQRAASALETERSGVEAQQRRAETEAHVAALGRLGSEKGLRAATRRSSIAKLEQDVARLEGERQVAEARVRLLDQEIALRQVRAPISGRIESVVELRAGSVVDAGARLASVVPPGGLRAVAAFDPATSVGRVRPGQRARLRLIGFPWTKYGSVPAIVNHVGSEPRDGQIRVELILQPTPGTLIPLQHGMPASAEVEVERVSPAGLVLDAAGRFLTRADDQSGSQSGSQSGMPAGTPAGTP